VYVPDDVKVEVPGLDATDTIGSFIGPIIPPLDIAWTSD
jgi:hypothetical protein